MKIYIAHSREYDYMNELYIPIRKNENLKDYQIILPHENNNISSNTRGIYKDFDLVIAECSYPSIGLGIELGWMYDDNTPIYCINQKNKKISNSIKVITNNIFEYTNSEEMINIIKEIIDIEKNK